MNIPLFDGMPQERVADLSEEHKRLLVDYMQADVTNICDAISAHVSFEKLGKLFHPND